MTEGSMFWDAVGNIVSQNIAAAPMDLTVNGEVVKLKNATNGEYLVKYQDNTFSAFATDPTMVYSQNEKVYVLVPQGNFSQKKMIIGRSSAQNNFTYAEMQELTNFYVPQSPNLMGDDFYGMDHDRLAITSCPRNLKQGIQRGQGANYIDYGFARWPASRVDPSDFEDEELKKQWYDKFGDESGNITAPENHINATDRFPTNFLDFAHLTKCDKLCHSWGQSWEYLGIKAKFRTEFLAEHNKGKYGIRVEYLVRNNAYKTDAEGNITSKDHRKFITKTIELTFDSFNGNPYAYVNDIEQVGYFQIPKGSCLGISRVSLFQNDEDVNVGDREIAASDMEIDYMPIYDSTGKLLHLTQYDNYTKNNIFCSDIDIRWYEKKNLLNSMFYVHISSDKGNSVYNDSPNAPGISYVDLKAHLFYGGKDILNEDDYEVHWYRECPDYRAASWPGTKKDVHNNYIASYSGDGWAPVFRPKDLTYGDAPKGLFVEEFGPWRVDDWSRPVTRPTDGHEAANYEKIDYRTMRVPRDRVPWEWYYTCVIVQKPKAEVKDNNGEVISNDSDTAISYKYKPSDNDMDVQGYRVVRTDSKYDLELSDLIDRAEGAQNHAYLYVMDKNDMDTTRSPAWPKTPWLGNWWYKYDGMQMGAFDGNVKNILGGDNGKNGIVDVTRHLGHSYVQFVVGAIDPNTLITEDMEVEGMDYSSYLEYRAHKIDDSRNEYWANYEETREAIKKALSVWDEEEVNEMEAKLQDAMINVEDDGTLHFSWNGDIRGLVVGILHKTLAKADGKDVIVEWEGQQHFIYNYDGSVKSWFSQDSFCVTPIVKWPKGKADFCSYKIYGPEGPEGGDGELHTLDYYDGIAQEQANTQTDKYSLKIGAGHNPRCNSMLQNIYVENLESGLYRAHFSVRQEYNTTYAQGQNSFWLVITLSDGTELEPFECPITFSKDGSGANGTGWSVDVDTCVPPRSIQDKNVNAFTRSKFLNPLVVQVQKNFGDQDNRWINYTEDNKTPKFPVFLRPFVYKGGYGTGARGPDYDISVENTQITDFFDFPAELGYWAETYWSAQFGSGTNDPDLQFNSYLKFYKPDGSLYTLTDWTADTGAPYPKGLDWTGREGSAAWTHSADGHNGAIEVRFNEDIASPDDSSHGFEFYQFIVTAMTVIYRGCERAKPNGEGFEIVPHQAGSELVTTIWSYYPVDILVIIDPLRFDPTKLDTRKIDCNWPREVLYSGTGVSPAFDDPSDGLYFFYDSQKRGSDDGKSQVEDFPRTMASHSFQWYPAFNLTQETQRITYIRAGKVELDETHQQLTRFAKPEVKVYDVEYDGLGNELPEEDKVYHWEWLTQKYSPTPEIQSTTLLFGLLSTDFKNRFDVDGDEENPEVVALRNDPFDGGAIFFRNQVFQLSRYSNNAVNAWNGRDIQIDNDEGSILAPTVVAGYKNPMTNDFSGVIMGIDKNQRKDGLYQAGMTSRADGIGNNNFEMKPGDSGFDNRQYLNSNLFEKYQQQNPYMAGVYGYQQGTPSFGLMENGTAFFGRADGGAQIVLDGTNGVIYGGGNGYLTSPSIKDPMWNSMRISLVDNTRDGMRNKIMPWKDGSYKKNDDDTLNKDEAVSKTGPYTSVNVYVGQHSTEDSEKCPPTNNPVRLDYYDFFSGVNDPHTYRENSRYKIPSWYKDIWRRATVKRHNKLPYFLQDTKICYDSLISFEEKIQEMLKNNNGKKFDADTDIWGEAELNGEKRGGDYRINYWDNSNALLTAKINGSTVEGTNKQDIEVGNVQMTTFGVGKASTTPAIEIGQHIPGLMPGILPWCAYQDVFEEFYIPGDRNFLVTYDGSLWAMNAVVIGNIIGSNIIGGRIQGAQVGIGCREVKEDYNYQRIVDDCDWPPLQAPDYVPETDPTASGVVIECGSNEVPAVYIDERGNMSCSYLRIFGGSLDVGTFHIIGKDTNWEYGELLQYGMSDFVGLVHCYGNLGIGPNMGHGAKYGSNYGHLTQVKGQVALGIVLKEDNTNVHEWVAKQMGMDQNYPGGLRSGLAPYGFTGDGDQKKIGRPLTLQQAAFFGIDASPDFPEQGGKGNAYRGHWWPMAFVYMKPKENEGGIYKLLGEGEKDNVPGWFTTMNLFKSEAVAAPVGIAGQTPNVQKGANYFRVSPFGTEARFIFIRESWQNEEDISEPTWSNYAGWFGLSERYGSHSSYDTQWAFGMTSTSQRPILINSSDNMALRSVGFIELSANSRTAHVRSTINGKQMSLMPTPDRLARIQLGRGMVPMGIHNIEKSDKAENVWAGQEEYDSGTIVMNLYKKGHFAVLYNDLSWYDFGGDNQEGIHNTHTLAGILIRHHPQQGFGVMGGTYIWDDCQQDSIGIKIVAGQGLHGGIWNHPSTNCWFNFSELWLGNMLWTISDGKGWVRGEGGHIYFEGDYAFEDHQHNIYARFA